MIRFGLLFALLLKPLVFAQSAPEGAWLQDGAKWSKAPREYNAKLHFARTAIIYFGADHTFALIYATVNRVPEEYEVISNGDGQEVYLGTWGIADNTIALNYRLVRRTVHAKGEQLPGPMKTESARRRGSALVFLGHSFHRSAALDESALQVAVPRGGR